MSDHPDRIYIDEMATMLSRAQHTIRQWLHRPDFPAVLQPHLEGGRKKLYWSPDQVDGLRDYAETRQQLRGSFGRA